MRQPGASLLVAAALARCVEQTGDTADVSSPDAGSDVRDLDARTQPMDAVRLDTTALDATRPDAHRRREGGVDVAMVLGPQRLSETGLYADIRARTIAGGVIEFTPRYELWSDGATKRRFLRLPPGTQIDTADPDQWVFPVGTRVWKEFRVGERVVETRLLERVQPGVGAANWWMVAYVWNEDETDAIAAPLGVDGARGTPHRVPSQEDCVLCHGNLRDVPIGVSALQLAGRPGPGGLSGLSAAGWLTAPVATEPEVPGDGVTRAALAYLHANCGHCHNDTSYFQTESVLRLRLSVRDRDPLATPTYRTTINVPMFHRYGEANLGVVPGDPERSQLWARMGVRDLWAMPPTCTLREDPEGLAAVRAWILALPPTR